MGFSPLRVEFFLCIFGEGGGGGWALIFVNVYSLGKEKNFEFETNHYKFSCCQERMLCGHLDCYT